MKAQNEFEKFYEEIKSKDISGFSHNFIHDNNVYFHATDLNLLEKILKEGFSSKESNWGALCCYFGKSFWSSLEHVKSKYDNCVVFAVDLTYLFESNNGIEYEIVPSAHEIKVKNSVPKECIIGYISV
ncbi:hypothetical protein CHI95_12740 [Providencia rettgeri]|uniref:Uncharacterized protein n=1 Tax=Providencia rettgeri TaxID=587 RepID=A0A264VSB0_PRORE|nr:MULTISPECIES: hypothetical protein [Providencia]MBQ0533053.1 hypothetical protein [Providencia huaxiensis]MBQ0590520.1 hypothetical protein [Providencia huaxiensis]MDI7241570.1 hypothetical protein [Providencia huaxiensis]OZS74185.1 hypothetical protein CHI95_12740 [Providencia rettgeri]